MGGALNPNRSTNPDPDRHLDLTLTPLTIGKPQISVPNHSLHSLQLHHHLQLHPLDGFLVLLRLDPGPIPSSHRTNGSPDLRQRRHLPQTQTLALIPPLALTHPTILNPDVYSYTSEGTTCNCTHLTDFSSFFVSTAATARVRGDNGLESGLGLGLRSESSSRVQW